MDTVEKINQLTLEFMMAESEVSACRMLGGVGRKMNSYQEKLKQVKEEIRETFKASGCTIKQLEELYNPDGSPALVYGAADVLHRLLPYDD